MSTKKVIHTDQAPKALGPYSQAVVASADSLLFISGQLGLDPSNMQMIAPDDVSGQTKQVLDNMKAVCQAAGIGMNDVVKTTILLSDMKDFDAVNKVYATYFTEPYPARACYQVAALPKNAKVEIEAVAVMTNKKA